MNKVTNYYRHDKENIFNTISIKNKVDDMLIGATPWLHKLESQTHIVAFTSPRSSLMQPVSMGISLQPRIIRVAPATSKKVLRSYVFHPNSGISCILWNYCEYLKSMPNTFLWIHTLLIDFTVKKWTYSLSSISFRH